MFASGVGIGRVVATDERAGTKTVAEDALLDRPEKALPGRAESLFDAVFAMQILDWLAISSVCRAICSATSPFSLCISCSFSETR